MAGKKRMQRSHRGKAVDMGALIMANEKAVALGNANMNARGDILGKGGVVVKSREEQAQEYYEQQSARVISTKEEPAVHVPKIEEDIILDTDDNSNPKKRKVTKTKKGE